MVILNTGMNIIKHSVDYFITQGKLFPKENCFTRILYIYSNSNNYNRVIY